MTSKKITKLFATAFVISSLFSANAALADSQTASMDQAIAVYQQMLNDPDLDPGARAQVQNMISQLRQQRADMSSSARSYNSYGNTNNYGNSGYPNSYTQGYPQSSQGYNDRNTQNESCDRCAQSAQ